MTEFKLRNRPRKPEEPRWITQELSGSISINELLKEVERLKQKHGYDLDYSGLSLACYEDDYNCYMSLELPPTPTAEYERKMVEYKVKLKDYNEWREKNKKQIELAKKQQKEQIALNKIKRTKARLEKELAEVESKLERKTK